MTHYLLWSMRNRQWWRPNAQGYTSDVDTAGRYPEAEAGVQIFGALPGAVVPVDEHFASQLAGLDADDVEKSIARWSRL